MMNNSKTNVTVNEVVELINTDSHFNARLLANKDRCAVYDRNNKKCAEIAYRNKTATFSTAVQCNRFDYARLHDTARALDTEYKYHACKNNRNYITINKIDSDDMLNFVFELLDSEIDTFD